MNELLCHLIGDYILQNDWMALNKHKSKWIAFFHGFMYSLPFIFLTKNLLILLIIGLSHAIIDHWKMANFIGQFKNFNFKTPDGFNPDRPIWLTVWLGIIVDNTMHLLINHLSLNLIK